MKSNFSDPAAPRSGNNTKYPNSVKNTPRDESTSCFIKAGIDYGVGYRNPMGHTGPAKARVPTMPYGRVKTMDLYED